MRKKTENRHARQAIHVGAASKVVELLECLVQVGLDPRELLVPAVDLILQQLDLVMR